MNRHLIAIASGVLGGSIPNKTSNIHPLLMGAILAILVSKILVGDYDAGYQWTFSDLLFVGIVGLEGVFGAWLVNVFS